MNRTVALVAAIAVLAAVSAAFADDRPDDGKGRYQLSPVDGGVMRLDRETGAVSMCAKKGDAWTCDAVEDRAKASDAAKLEQENRDLKARIRTLEDQAAALPGAIEPPAPKAQLPTEEEVDKALDYVENIFKKFRDRIRKYESEIPPPPLPPPTAEKDSKDGRQL